MTDSSTRVTDEENPPDWRRTWGPMVAAVGRQFGADRPRVWGERIEISAIARYLEPLELDCRLHSDVHCAHEQGYAGQVAPYTALVSLSLPLIWRPGAPRLYETDQRNAKVDMHHLTALNRCGLEPPTMYSFVVQWDMEFIRPALVGERLCRHGSLLLSCVPKATSVGQGAFVQWESEIFNESEDVLAKVRSTSFLYNRIEGKGA